MSGDLVRVAAQPLMTPNLGDEAPEKHQPFPTLAGGYETHPHLQVTLAQREGLLVSSHRLA